MKIVFINDARVLKYNNEADTSSIRQIKLSLANVPIIKKDTDQAIGMVREATWHIDNYILANIAFFDVNEKEAKKMSQYIEGYELTDGRITALILKDDKN